MSPLDPRTPVLVGAAALHQRTDDPEASLDAFGLMARAARDAGADAGVPGLVDRVGLVVVPEGTWRGGVRAADVGAPDAARTLLVQVGVLQQTALTRAADAIARGQVDTALVVGGEAKHRDRRLAAAGAVAPSADPATADEVLSPGGDILHPVEIERELAWPVRQYAVVEQALGAADGMDPAAQQAVVDEMWARLASVSTGNPWAWSPGPVAAEDLAPSAANPMLATPYTRRHTSNWNVDQAAALLLCSAATASAAGVPRDRWVFPWAGVESNHMVPLVARADVGSCPAIAIAGEAAAAATGVAPADADHVDLYSCFPVAVRLQARAFGRDLVGPLSVTGGMAGAGGPLNSYSLGALAAMADVLREDAGSVGLVTSVSGMLTKVGLGVWSTRPPGGGFRAVDVSAEVAAATAVRPVDPSLEGPATVVGATLVHDGGVPSQGVAVVEADDGVRTVATTEGPPLLPVGDRVTLAGGVVRR